MEQRPTYRAGFALDIALELMRAHVLALLFIATPSFAQQIVERGHTMSGCPEPTAKGKSRVEGSWLALRADEIEKVDLYTVKGLIYSNKKDSTYFFNSIALKEGRVSNATLKPLKTRTLSRSEYEVQINRDVYKFITWGPFEFTVLKSQGNGKFTTVPIDGYDGIVPKSAYKITNTPPDDYEGGHASVIRTGDFNGDGVTDFLLGYAAKEAEGVHLLLSNPKSGGYSAPITSATSYGDC